MEWPAIFGDPVAANAGSRVESFRLQPRHGGSGGQDGAEKELKAHHGDDGFGRMVLLPKTDVALMHQP